MRRLPSRAAPVLKNYLVHASSPLQPFGPYVGRVEGCVSLLDAAESAATLLFFRFYVRPVAALKDERGVFVAYGKVPWMKHPRGSKEEVRFMIQLEKLESLRREEKGESQ